LRPTRQCQGEINKKYGRWGWADEKIQDSPQTKNKEEKRQRNVNDLGEKVGT
jgi:hypothetical protein